MAKFCLASWNLQHFRTTWRFVLIVHLVLCANNTTQYNNHHSVAPDLSPTSPRMNILSEFWWMWRSLESSEPDRELVKTTFRWSEPCNVLCYVARCSVGTEGLNGCIVQHPPVSHCWVLFVCFRVGRVLGSPTVQTVLVTSGFFLGFSASLLPSCHLQPLWPSSSDRQQGRFGRQICGWLDLLFFLTTLGGIQ